MRPLFKTTVVIWSEYDPTEVELSSLAREAEQGDAYCSKQVAEKIEDPTKDSDWDGTEFFDEDEPSGDGGPPYDAATATGMYDRDD